MKASAKMSTPPLATEESLQETLGLLWAADQSAKDILWIARANGLAIDDLTEWLYAQEWPISILDVPRRQR